MPQAAETGRSRSEVLAAAIRRGLGGGRLAETLAAYRTGEEISEDDAMALAKAELAAARAERPTARSRPIITLIDAGVLVPVVTQHLVDEVVDVLGRPKLSKYVKPGAGAAFQEQMHRLSKWHSDVVDAPQSRVIRKTTISSPLHSARTPTPSQAATTTYTRPRTSVSRSSLPANS